MRVARLAAAASAPVAQLDRALPSEGRGHRFESCRVRHCRTKDRSPEGVSSRLPDAARPEV